MLQQLADLLALLYLEQVVEHLEGEFDQRGGLGREEGLQDTHGEEEETVGLAGHETQSLDLLALGVVTVQQHSQQVLDLGLVAFFGLAQVETPLCQELLEDVLGGLLGMEDHLSPGVVEVLGVFLEYLLGVGDDHGGGESLVVGVEETVLHLVVLDYDVDLFQEVVDALDGGLLLVAQVQGGHPVEVAVVLHEQRVQRLFGLRTAEQVRLAR